MASPVLAPPLVTVGVASPVPVPDIDGGSLDEDCPDVDDPVEAAPVVTVTVGGDAGVPPPHPQTSRPRLHNQAAAPAGRGR